MPSKLKTISVRLPDEVREWVEAQDVPAGRFIYDMVIVEWTLRDSPEGHAASRKRNEAARMTVPVEDVKLSADEIEKTVFGEPTADQLAFRKRMLAPKAKK